MRAWVSHITTPGWFEFTPTFGTLGQNERAREYSLQGETYKVGIHSHILSQPGCCFRQRKISFEDAARPVECCRCSPRDSPAMCQDPSPHYSDKFQREIRWHMPNATTIAVRVAQARVTTRWGLETCHSPRTLLGMRPIVGAPHMVARRMLAGCTTVPTR